jgi:hypothetical protein
MSDILPFIPLALLVLACPLVMGALGVGAWLVARARGQKKQLSIGCMGHGRQHGQPVEPREDAERPKPYLQH